METGLVSIVSNLRFGTEMISIILVMIGIGVTLYNLAIKMLILGHWDYYHQARVLFSRFLIVALEFQLASDIMGTAISPSWSQLGQIAAIALIRTFLNYFLLREERAQELERPSAHDAAKSATG